MESSQSTGWHMLSAIKTLANIVQKETITQPEREESATVGVWEVLRPGLGPVLLNPTARPVFRRPSVCSWLCIFFFFFMSLA